jgi:hypothetical protein
VKLEEKVQGEVARLLAMVCNEFTDPAAYELVLADLTRMSILGTLPPGSVRSPAPLWSYESEGEESSDDDFSERKENFIAP